MMWRMMIIVILLLGSSTAFPANRNVIDDFESSPVDHFPRSWRTWPFQRTKAVHVYRVVEEENNRFLRAIDTNGVSVQLLRNFDWDIKQYPTLSWRWRARELPEGAQESEGDKNDSSCGVYVIVNRVPGRVLKYVWSTSLASNHTVSRKEGKLKIKVLDSGKKNVGTWQYHEVNVAADYQALFGDTLERNPTSIAVLTDSNATLSPAACDYDDFVIAEKK